MLSLIDIVVIAIKKNKQKSMQHDKYPDQPAKYNTLHIVKIQDTIF